MNELDKYEFKPNEPSDSDKRRRAAFWPESVCLVGGHGDCQCHMGEPIVPAVGRNRVIREFPR